MIALPFIYFGLWFFVEFRKRGLDVYSFILLLYTIISLFSILLDVSNAYTTDSCPQMPTLGVIAPFVYIILLTICIHPFSKFNSNYIKQFAGSINEKRFNLVVYLYFGMFLTVLLVSATRIQEILTSNALAEIRYEMYTGEAVSFYDHLSGLPRYICAICSVLGPSSFIMILFFFIGLTHFHKGVLFSIITLCDSLTMLLIAINIVDRSNFAYWGLTFVMCYVLFRKRLTKEAKRKFYILALVLVSLFLAYLVVVTVSRFGEREGGALGGIYLYLGQSYINFCNFFNYLIFEVPHKPEVVLFPNINTFFLKGPSYFEFAEKIRPLYHHGVAVFSTFIGLIMSVSGLLVTVLYCLIYGYIVRLVTKRPRPNSISIKKMILFWVVVLNPVLGLFGYYYMSVNAIYAIFVWLFLGVFLTTKVTFKRNIE